MDVIAATMASLPPFIRVPFEIYLLVADHLDATDLFNLGLVCKHLRDVFRDNSLCRAHLQRNVPFARELSWLQPAAHNLRARTKRCQAIASLQPYAAGVAAYAESYIYMNNTLVYVCDRMMRMLYLGPNTTVRSERNVDIRAMLDEVLPESEGTSRYSFQPLHYAAGIVSCIYAHHRIGCAQENWLVFFNPETGWNLNCRIPFPHHRLFVRNNESHLIYGMFTSRTRITAAENPGAVAAANTTAATDSQTGRDQFFEAVTDDGGEGHRRCWRMRHLDIATKKWSDFDSHAIDPIVGLGEFGKDLCFEIIDGYFYVVASEQRFVSADHETEYMSKMHKDDVYLFDEHTDSADPLQDSNSANDDSLDGSPFFDDYTTGTQPRRARNAVNRSSSVSDSSTSDSSTSDSSKSELIDIAASQYDTFNSEQDSEQNSYGSDESSSDGSDANRAQSLCREMLFRRSSFFTCFRFRITNDLPVVEQPTLKSRWRRRHNEGALDERWATLKLQKSSETGEILVIEERREWLGDSRNSTRSYYMQPLVFASDLRARDLARQAKSTSLSDESHSSGSSAPSGKSSVTGKRKRLPRFSDLVPKKRLAQNVHFGDNAALINPPTISDCFGRFYSRDASTYVDLVNMSQHSTGGSLHIGLRAGSRVLSLKNEADSAVDSDDDNIQVPKPFPFVAKPVETYPKYPIAEIKKSYVPSDLWTWPKQPKEDVDPKADANDHPDRRKNGVLDTKSASTSAAKADGKPEASENARAESDIEPTSMLDVKPDGVLTEKTELTEAERAENDLLGPVLNPPGCTGSITSTWDERLLVYSTKMGSLIPNLHVRSKPKPVRAIVLVSFDPTLCLPGLKVWQDAKRGCEPRLVQGNGQHMQGQQSKETVNPQAEKEEKDTAAVEPEAPANKAPHWVSTADPNYAGIRNGFDFSYHVNT